MFDPDNFQSATVEGEISTQSVVVPAMEYTALIDSIETREVEGKKGLFYMLDVMWSIDDADVAALTGRDISKVKQSIFLDLTDSGGLDMAKGKNVGLGRLRKAIGQDDPGPWSFNNLAGNVAKVKVEHRPFNGNTYAEIKTVVAL